MVSERTLHRSNRDYEAFLKPQPAGVATRMALFATVMRGIGPAAYRKAVLVARFGTAL